MNNITVVRKFMANKGLEYLLVNSTNEFLVEYNTLEENSRYKLTKFSGSTGEALVTPENIFLFVDGRYHIQADNEVNHELVTVVKLQTGQNSLTEILNKIPKTKTLGIFSKKISEKKREYLEANVDIKLLDRDPLDSKTIQEKTKNIALDIEFTGIESKEKINTITKDLKNNQAIYVTDLDEVSYLYNLRNYSQEYSAKIKGKAILEKNAEKLYLIDELDTLSKKLKELDKEIFIDKNTINAFDYEIIKDKAKSLVNSPIQEMKAIKNHAELNHLKKAFNKTDLAMRAIRKYIDENDNISEYDIAKQLEKEFLKQGAKGLSFKSIIARNKNSALAHYSKHSKNEIVDDGDLILIDCGGYFDGGLATDITRVFVKGTPNELQRKIYTLVLKAFLRAYNYSSNNNSTLTGFDIDKNIHDFFNNEDVEGFVFNHGLGHGIGINVHEYPPNLSTKEIAKTEIKEGMCFSIEPGLYKEDAFGIRLENSCYYENKKIRSFVKMNYEKKLINFDMLNNSEKQWLEEFEVI